MIGVDTNVLARYYVEDRTDAATGRQREAARRLIESGQPLMVCISVVLELEWVLRGYYRCKPDQVMQVFAHLMSLPQVTIENRNVLERALANVQAGLDLADALHHASYRDCARVATFDDRGFARRARKLGLAPVVTVPT